MSRPLLEFGGGLGEILRDLLHLRSVSEAEALISGAEGRRPVLSSWRQDPAWSSPSFGDDVGYSCNPTSDSRSLSAYVVPGTA